MRKTVSVLALALAAAPAEAHMTLDCAQAVTRYADRAAAAVATGVVAAALHGYAGSEAAWEGSGDAGGEPLTAMRVRMERHDAEVMRKCVVPTREDALDRLRAQVGRHAAEHSLSPKEARAILRLRIEKEGVDRLASRAAPAGGRGGIAGKRLRDGAGKPATR
ncbi:MAG: hypothetical protein OXI22_03270 [Defluviicoccus sp.]|nr:hypothetical protein [Defluviicoccus sp.]MDE0382880.1 hypothetical protein [Defluviicoccus sp.]